MTTSLNMHPETEARYTRLARDTGRTKTFYLNAALDGAIDQLEWEYGILQDLEEIKTGKQKTVPLSEVMTEYGL